MSVLLPCVIGCSGFCQHTLYSEGSDWNIEDIQRQIDCLSGYCTDWNVYANIQKTKITAFGKTFEVLKTNEKFYFPNQEIEVKLVHLLNVQNISK